MVVGEEEQEAGHDLEISLPLHHCELLAACLKGQRVNWRCILTESMSQGGRVSWLTKPVLIDIFLCT